MTSALALRTGRPILPIASLDLDAANEPLPVDALFGHPHISPALRGRPAVELRHARVSEYELSNIDSLAAAAYQRQRQACDANAPSDDPERYVFDWLCFRYALEAPGVTIDRWLRSHASDADLRASAGACAVIGFATRGMGGYALRVIEGLRQEQFKEIAFAALALRATDVLRCLADSRVVARVYGQSICALAHAAMTSGAARICSALLQRTAPKERQRAYSAMVMAAVQDLRGSELPKAQAACFDALARERMSAVLRMTVLQLDLRREELTALVRAMSPTEDDLERISRLLLDRHNPGSSELKSTWAAIREALRLEGHVQVASPGLTMP